MYVERRVSQEVIKDIIYIYKYILYLLFLAVVNQQHLCVIVLIFQLD